MAVSNNGDWEVLAEAKNAKLFANGVIRIDNVRLSYPHLAEPWAKTEADTPRYSCTGILPKDTHAEARKLILRRIKSLLKSEGKDGRPLSLPADKLFLRDGDANVTASDDDEEDADTTETARPEYANAWTVAAAERKSKPSLRNKRGRVCSKTEEDEFYAGCFVNLWIRPWFQNNKFGKRMNANLVMVQFRKDGDPLGGGRISESDLDSQVDSMDDDDDLDNEYQDGDDDL